MRVLSFRARLVSRCRRLLTSSRSVAESNEGNVRTLSRLIGEQAVRHWKVYLASFILMAVLALRQPISSAPSSTPRH